jgi:hypothetical protein
MTIYLTPHRWAMKTGLVNVIVDEEKNIVIAYSRQTNKYLLDTVSVGIKRFEGFRRGGLFNWGKFTEAGKETFLGETVVVLVRKGTRADITTKNDVVITERQLSCPRIKLSRVFDDISYALFDIEYKYGLPLQVSRMAHSANPRYCTRRPVLNLDTTSIKEGSFAASEFEVPKGLTRVKTEVDLFTNDMDGIPGSSNAEILRQRERQLHIKAVP